jgi:hypothetical protein
MENLFKVDPKAGLPGNQLIQGLTKREYFAAMAMIGLLANKFSPGSDYNVWAVEIADRLIEKLNETKP